MGHRRSGDDSLRPRRSPAQRALSDAMCANQGSLHRASEWASPPELTLSSTPRPVRLTVPRVLVWSVVPAMLLILLSVAVSLRLRRQHAFVQRMAAEGVVTNGKVAFVKGSFSGSSLTAGKYTY